MDVDGESKRYDHCFDTMRYLNQCAQDVEQAKDWRCVEMKKDDPDWANPAREKRKISQGGVCERALLFAKKVFKTTAYRQVDVDDLSLRSTDTVEVPGSNMTPQEALNRAVLGIARQGCLSNDVDGNSLIYDSYFETVSALGQCAANPEQVKDWNWHRMTAREIGTEIGLDNDFAEELEDCHDEAARLKEGGEGFLKRAQTLAAKYELVMPKLD